MGNLKIVKTILTVSNEYKKVNINQNGRIYGSRLAKINDDFKKDDVITFEELGVDKLFIDEARNYKNLFLHTKMRNVAGIAQS